MTMETTNSSAKEGRRRDMTKAEAVKTEPTTPAKSKGWTLETLPDPPGRSRDYVMAQVAADGIVGNARAVVSFSGPTFGELSLTDSALVLKETAQAMNGGDLSAAIAMLAAQAMALNAMFGELARVGQANMFKAPEYADRYLRLAFKAQGQSRATLETLAAIKNPPVMFARQANINNGGQQQVNNAATDSCAAAAAAVLARGETCFPAKQTCGGEPS
jgi:hypothetical protein